jgi:hypothetical protein
MIRAVVRICGMVVIASIGMAARTGTAVTATTISTTVESFEVKGQTRMAALLTFCQTFGLPLGVEFLDPEALTQAVEVSARNQSVGSTLDLILPAAKGYQWSLEDGIVHVSSGVVPRGPKNLLDVVISDFRFRQPATVQWASENVKMALSHELHPEILGFAGHYPTGNPKDIIPPFAKQNATVRELLNTIVRESPVGAAWVVRTSPAKLDKIPERGLWKIFEYQKPPGDVQLFVQHLLE